MTKKKQTRTLLPPKMGWSTWNRYKQNISEKLVLETATLMKEKGLLDAGYRYINLDDCWQASERTKEGKLKFDTGRFPNEEKIVEKLNNLGFKAGIYSSCGTLTCEDLPGSYGFEEIDAQTFAEWGFEYLKYDYCHVVDLPTDPHYELKGFATNTPPIMYLGAALEKGKEEVVLPAESATLRGFAKLKENAIVDLNFEEASAMFKVNASEKGLYQIALGYQKSYSENRQFVLLSTNDHHYQIWFPRSSGWNSTARVMVEVNLQKGENEIFLTNPMRGQKEDSIMRYSRMGQALIAAAPTDKPIFFSVCEHGRAKPWTWAAEFAGSWRSSGDIHANWHGITNCYESVADLWKYQQPGAYNDPDMLEVGNGNLSEIENMSHFVLWCMLSAPLILGMDVATISDKYLSLIKNPDLISLNQDSSMLQASRHKLTFDLDLLIKPLSGGRVAICLFNKSEEIISDFKFDWKLVSTLDTRVELNTHQDVNITNMLGSDCELSNSILTIPAILSHEVKLFLLEAQ